jgi:formylglycine-generating enzyme required for sulfatase activity
MGTKEVNNRLFRMFRNKHQSGTLDGHNLNGPSQPVVRITWEEAALFCNWLSARESLPPVYQQVDERIVAATPMGTGYRLPTEAEWEYCARFQDGKAVLKYPWGNTFPPGPGSGNFADESARDLLPAYIKGYNDRHAVTAPAGRFKANALGLFDIGGNVAEWCHDYYSIYSYKAGKTYSNPVGPADGRHHVVRGSGWKHAFITALRSAYRDYSDSKRPDLGFRVCRYAE